MKECDNRKLVEEDTPETEKENLNSNPNGLGDTEKGETINAQSSPIPPEKLTELKELDLKEQRPDDQDENTKCNFSQIMGNIFKSCIEKFKSKEEEQNDSEKEKASKEKISLPKVKIESGAVKNTNSDYVALFSKSVKKIDEVTLSAGRNSYSNGFLDIKKNRNYEIEEYPYIIENSEYCEYISSKELGKNFSPLNKEEKWMNKGDAIYIIFITFLVFSFLFLSYFLVSSYVNVYRQESIKKRKATIANYKENFLNKKKVDNMLLYSGFCAFTLTVLFACAFFTRES